MRQHSSSSSSIAPIRVTRRATTAVYHHYLLLVVTEYSAVHTHTTTNTRNAAMIKTTFALADSLRTALAQPPEARPRWLRADVDHGAALIALGREGAPLSPHSPAAAAAAAAAFDDVFALLREDVSSGTAASQPRLFLVSATDGSARWHAVTYVPDAAHPRAKMSIAAGRDDVKRALGPAAFVPPDYHATELGELTAAAFRAARERGDPAASMSAMEREHAETTRASASMATARAVAGLAPVPFTLDASAVALLRELGGGGGDDESGGRVVQLGIRDEKFVVLTTKDVLAAPGALSAIIAVLADASREPRYYVIRRSGGGEGVVLSLLYHCRADSPPRLRMTYATGKAALLSALTALLLLRDPIRTLEATDAEDIAAHAGALWAAAAPPPSSSDAVGGAVEGVAPGAAAECEMPPPRGPLPGSSGVLMPGLGASASRPRGPGRPRGAGAATPVAAAAVAAPETTTTSPPGIGRVAPPQHHKL